MPSPSFASASGSKPVQPLPLMVGPYLGDAPKDAALRTVIFGSSAGQKFTGVALKLFPVNGEDLFEVLMVIEGERARISLGIFKEEDVVAHWRGLGASMGLPLYMEMPDGSLQSTTPHLDGLPLGPIRIRRGHGMLRTRRPRFLVRRKVSRLPLRPVVYRGREIVEGKGV